MQLALRQRTSGRAAVYGAILFAVVAAVCLGLGAPRLGSIWEDAWLILAACALGSLSAGGGAVAARTVSESSEDKKPFQFSILELLVAFLLLAVLFGYFAHAPLFCEM